MSAGRIASLDVVRGFALIGISLINAYAISHPGSPPGFQSTAIGVDKIVQVIIILLIESKFFTLFSLLFGIGFYFQLANARKQGIQDSFFIWRMIGLFLFGAIHVVFLWEGDILIIYSITGTLLFFLRNKSDERLIQISKWLLIVPAVAYLVMFGSFLLIQTLPSLNKNVENINSTLIQVFQQTTVKEKNVILTSTYFELIPNRLKAYIGALFLLITRIPVVMAMFICGYLIARNNILLNGYLFLPKRKIKLILLAGLVLSVIITTGYFSLPAVPALLILFFNQALAGPLTAIGTLLWLFMNLPLHHSNFFLKRISDLGRMPLTNYLLQSTFYTILFYGYGFAIAETVVPTTVIVVAFVVSLILIAFSSIYLVYFKSGPLEWIWRSITYRIH